MWKKLFNFKIHKHQYKKIGFKQAEDKYSRYSLRKYQCQICEKTKWVDGRMDYLEHKAN